jgi:hypothetical protein
VPPEKEKKEEKESVHVSKKKKGGKLLSMSIIRINLQII